MMEITINDVLTQVEKDSSLEDVVRLKGLDNKGGVAVAVNGRMVKRDDWAQFTLHPLDKVLIINAAYGG